MDILDTMTLEQLRAKMRGMQLAIDESHAALVDGRRGDAMKYLHAYSTPPGRAPLQDHPNKIA